MALGGPEIVPNVIVNHQQRRRRNVLLSPPVEAMHSAMDVTL